MRIRLITACALASILLTCAEHTASRAAADTPTAATSDAMTAVNAAFQQLINAEDNNFADIEGRRRGSNAEVTTFKSNVSIPQHRCIIVAAKSSNAIFGVCVIVLDSQAHADAAILTEKSAAMAADGALHAQSDAVQVKGAINQWDAKSDKHAVELYEYKDVAKSNYEIDVLFGTAASIATAATL